MPCTQSNSENTDGQGRHGSGLVACLTVALGGIVAIWGVSYGGIIFVAKPQWDYDLAMLAAHIGVPLWALMLSVFVWISGSLAVRRLGVKGVHVDQEKPCVRCSRLFTAAGMAACVVSLAVLVSFRFVDVDSSITVGFYVLFVIYPICVAFDFVRQFRGIVRLRLSMWHTYALIYAMVGILALAVAAGCLVYTQNNRFGWWLMPEPMAT